MLLSFLVLFFLFEITAVRPAVSRIMLPAIFAAAFIYGVGMERILEKYPKLEWVKPGDTNIQSLAQSYQIMISSQLLDPADPELRARVRSQFGLRKEENPSPVIINRDTQKLVESILPVVQAWYSKSELAQQPV